MQDEHPGIIIRAYIDDIHLIGPDKDVAAAFDMLRGLLAEQNLTVGFGEDKTSAWSPAWESDPSQMATSAVLGPLRDTIERIHAHSGGIATLGTFVGTDAFIKSKAMARIASPRTGSDMLTTAEAAKVEDDFRRACDAVADLTRFRSASSVHCANVLLLKCIVPKVSYMLELLPPELAADAAKAAHALVVSTYGAINDLAPEELAAVLDRLVLPPSLCGCGLRYYPDVSPAAYFTSLLHTAPAAAAAIQDAEDAQSAAAVAAAAVAADDTSSASSTDYGPLVPVRRAARAPAAPAAAAPILPATTALEDVSAELTATMNLLPSVARATIDPAVIGTTELEEYAHLQRTLTRSIEEERAAKVHDAAKAAVTSAVPGSETFRRAQRDLAHLNSCEGEWLLAPALSWMCIPSSFYRVRIRRFLNLPIPVCDFAGGVGSSRPPRSANAGVNQTHDLYGDFTLSTFNAPGQAQWTDLHEAIKNFFYKAARQAGITSVTREKRADLSTTDHRPGDLKIGSTRHGWKAARGKTLLIDFATISAVCAEWVDKSADTVGGGAKGKADKKTSEVLNRGDLSDNQYFQPLVFESEGHVPQEARQLLHAWAKMYA